MGSSSTSGNKIVIRLVGDRFYPYKKVAKTIVRAIKSKFGEGYSSWKKVPIDRRNIWFEEFKKTYTWAEEDDLEIRKNFESRGSSKYISITKAVRMKKTQPPWMGDLAYANLSAYWQTNKYKEKFEKALDNRNSDAGASMHTSGAKPHFAIWEEMRQENSGVVPSMDDFFMRTHKIHKGSNVGEWVSLQSQQMFDNYFKFKEEVLSNYINETEGMSQDDVTQPNIQPNDLAIFAQSVGGKKKGRVVGIGSLGKILDDNYLTSTHLQSDDRCIVSMKNKMEELKQDNERLRQQQNDSMEEFKQENQRLRQQQEDSEIRHEQTKRELDETERQLNENNIKLDFILQHCGIKLP